MQVRNFFFLFRDREYTDELKLFIWHRNKRPGEHSLDLTLRFIWPNAMSRYYHKWFLLPAISIMSSDGWLDFQVAWFNVRFMIEWSKDS